MMTHLSAGNALMISLVGFLTVFFILLIISVLVRCMSWVIRRIDTFNSSKGKGKAAPATATAEMPSSPLEGETSEEELLLMTAVIAAWLGTSPDRLVVREIRPVNDNSGWAASARRKQLH